MADDVEIFAILAAFLYLPAEPLYSVFNISEISAIYTSLALS